MVVTAEHIGQEVTNGERTGILQTLWLGQAWVRPKLGGVEWNASPSELFVLEEEAR
ncbi:hypothetical protein ACVNF4_05645 [Streptomyces sp. S6]